MKLAIMQPYLFPYIGYFQLIKAVDKFVIYDDVNYIKQGWINRNRILLHQHKFLFTLHVSGASSFKLINQIKVGCNHKKLLKTIELAYKRAPYFQHVFYIVEDILSNPEINLAKFIEYSIYQINEYLGITTEIIISSNLKKNNELKNQDKVIHICELLNANTYINAIGGQKLYSKENFLKKGIDLKFIRSKPIVYKQFNNEFIPWLSIIDVMMFNSKDRFQVLLRNFELI